MTHYKYLAWLIPLEFYLSQNQYFGWNSTPKSDAELVADGITFLLVLLTLIFIRTYAPSILITATNTAIKYEQS